MLAILYGYLYATFLSTIRELVKERVIGYRVQTYTSQGWTYVMMSEGLGPAYFYDI
jgi:hypothetical protein